MTTHNFQVANLNLMNQQNPNVVIRNGDIFIRNQNVAIGLEAQPQAPPQVPQVQTIAIGLGARNYQNQAIAIGAGARARNEPIALGEYGVDHSLDWESTKKNSNSIAIGPEAISSYGSIMMGFKSGNHKNFLNRERSIHIGWGDDVTFIDPTSNINIGNILEANRDTKSVIIPGTLTVKGLLDAPNVARNIDMCDGCGQQNSFGFEWDVCDEENSLTNVEAICLRCIHRTALQFVAKENWATTHGDPLSNLRNEFTHKLDTLRKELRKELREELRNELINTNDYIDDGCNL